MQQLALTMDQPRLSTTVPTRPTIGRKGSLTEMIVSDESAIQPQQLLPLLVRCDAEPRWLMWLSANQRMNKQWLASLGLEQSPVIHIDLCYETQLSLTCRILNAGNSHLIVEWQGELSQDQRLTIQALAAETGSHVILIQRR